MDIEKQVYEQCRQRFCDVIEAYANCEVGVQLLNAAGKGFAIIIPIERQDDKADQDWWFG